MHSLVRRSLAPVIFGLLSTVCTHSALAEDNLSVTQSWCADGTFRFKVESVGVSLPGPFDICISLASGRMYSPQALRLDSTLHRPAGNSLEYVLSNVLNRADLSRRSIVLKAPRTYTITSGECGSHRFFTVQVSQYTSMPSLNTEGGAFAASQCRFDSRGLEVRSSFDLTGVYQRTNGQSLQDFASWLL